MNVFVPSIFDGTKCTVVRSPRCGTRTAAHRGSREQLLRRHVKRFRGGLVFKALTFVSLNSRLESNKEEAGSSPHCRLSPSPFFPEQRYAISSGDCEHCCTFASGLPVYSNSRYQRISKSTYSPGQFRVEARTAAHGRSREQPALPLLPVTAPRRYSSQFKNNYCAEM